MEKNRAVIYSIASLLALTLICIIIRFVQLRDYVSFLWICYIAIFGIIVGLLRKNPYIILSQVIILAIPDLFWMIDFGFLLFTGHPLLGLVGYFSTETIWGKIASLQHLYTVPLSLWALSIIKFKKKPKVVLASLIEVSVAFILTFFLVPFSRDINCVHVNCINILINTTLYPLLWFVFVFSSIVISYLIIISLKVFRK